MDNGFWTGLISIWAALRDIITFKLSFMISLFLFYFLVRTIKELRPNGLNLKNKNKV